MIIYKITCKTTNKIYIGQTINTIEQRFKKHIHDAFHGLNTHFARAIRKYGADAFQYEIIDSAETQEELTVKEYYWITKLNAADSNIGYNECVNPNKSGGNTYQSKTADELSRIKHKISEANSGKNNGQAKSIKCLNIKTNQEFTFDTIVSCAEFLGVKNRTQIRRRLNGDKHVYKDEWLIVFSSNDYPKDYLILDRSTLKGTAVKVTNLTTNQSITFTSKRKAAEYLKIDRKAIINNAIINNYKIEF